MVPVHKPFNTVTINANNPNDKFTYIRISFANTVLIIIIIRIT